MHAIASYRTNRVDTASPLQLVVMLYQELLRRIELGARALEGEAPIEATPHFHRARDILTELLASLRADGDDTRLVANLAGLYKWAAAELVAAGRDKDPGRARRAADVLMPLLEGWAAIARGTAP